MERKTLNGLRPQAYEHPLDTRALDALQCTKGFDTLVRKLNEWGFERLLRVQLTGSNLRVTPDNFPEIHDKVREAGAVLDLPKLPDVYIGAGGEINAFTAGVEKPILVLTSGAVDLLTDEELFFVIAHSGEYEKVLAAPHSELQAARFCTQCGAALSAAAAFCTGCGAHAPAPVVH